VTICPSCGRENADDARFCSWCATPLNQGAAAREERKVVTCLFCDLVGFTARAESMDPEDVRRLLQPYHALVRSELERYGGTVEKFIGDAVMAVFGAPIAHEDDPERAVRAALAIRETLAEEGDLEVRIGITTGEALIALDARPETGEGMASGDVVNTASRLQAAAPTGTIFVDETTYRATDRTVEFEDATAVEAKGKSSPVRVWKAVSARARVGVERVGGADLVGRTRELALLRETFGRVKRERSPQLLTLVGVPGIGKSRLVYELFATIQTGEFGLVFWRHGRSLPYGDGVTFWALGEVVKAQAGILESDGPAEAAEKLGLAVRSVIPDAAEAGWVERHVRALAGLDAEAAAEAAQRGEAFAAWRRFLEGLAEERPSVVVFEDLHWADEAMLEFVDYLAEWAGDVPLLVLCTARPELLTRRPGWGGGKVNSSTILLSPLDQEETAALVHALLGRSVIDAELQARLLEHAGGNPLYAEEFTRMLNERPGDALVPETVQGLIAARLDTLAREDKELLCDAAVIGRGFWLGALGHERWKLEERLHGLERVEFVRRERRSSVAGEIEYSFRHALMRDVAYELIPRAQRAEKHRHAAEWIESLGRVEDHAEMVAHHHGAALEYARTTGMDVEPFEEPARAAFREAGDRAFALHAFEQAAVLYERSLDLSPDLDRGALLLRYGRSLALSGDERCLRVLEEAAQVLATEDREHSAEAHAFLTEALQQRGRRDEAYDHMEQALALVRDAPRSASKARVLAESSRLLVLAAQPHEAIAVAGEAFEVADTLGLNELAARALTNVAIANMNLGEFERSVADLERSIELASAVNSPEAARGLHNLGAPLWGMGDLERSQAAVMEAIRVSEQLGFVPLTLASRCFLSWMRYFRGAWDDAFDNANAIIAECEAGALTYFEYQPRIVRARIDLARGGSDEAVLEDIARALEGARAAKDPQALVPALSHSTFVLRELSRRPDAESTAAELVEVLAGGSLGFALWGLDAFAWCAAEFGASEVVRRALQDARLGVWREPYEAVVEGDLERVATVFAALGYVDEGYARLKLGQKLLANSHRADARVELDKALAFYRSLGATRYVRQAEALLGGAGLEIPA
jgi:class 3 adenylate cyclase/tetratricopeptide (TPR) repeat protein